MHVCFLARGSFGHLAAFVEFFRRRGHRISLIHLDPRPMQGIQNHSAAVGTFDPVRGKWKLPLHLLRVVWHVWRVRPDVLHAHYATSAGLLGALSGFRPLVVTCHGSDVVLGEADPIRRAALRIALARASVVHVVSNDLRGRALALGAVPERVVVSSVGVTADALLADRPFREAGSVHILWTRRLEPIYDPVTLIEGLAVLEDRGREFTCTLAAGGGLENRLRAMVRRRNLQHRVRFLGGFERAQLRPLLVAADVYVTCAVSDGASLSLLEAMAGGLFPVATDIPANREWIVPGENGVLFAPGDALRLAEALDTACAMRLRWRRVAEHNREIVALRGDRDKNLGELEAVYRTLVPSQ
jgi:glycosyltransferase involved in cell wall biosynthesis